MKRFPLPLVAAFALAGCGQPEGQGGLTAEEERQLDNAAQMLDDNMVDLPSDSLVANETDFETIDEPAEGDPTGDAQ